MFSISASFPFRIALQASQKTLIGLEAVGLLRIAAMVACMSLPETPSQRGEKNSTPEMPEQCSLDNEVASICRDRPEVLEVLQDVMTQQNWESDGHYRGRKAFVLRVIKVCTVFYVKLLLAGQGLHFITSPVVS